MSKEKEDLKEYYGITLEDQLAVIVDNEEIGTEYAGRIWEGEPYIEYSVVRTYLNKRVYVDLNENLLLYTLPTGTISARVGSKEYTFQKEIKESNYPFLKMEGKVAYVALDFVKQYTNMEYALYQDKGLGRVVIDCYEGNLDVATIRRSVDVRTAANKKSTILARAEKNATVRILSQDDSWTRIRTEDGFMGYIMNRYLKNQKTVQVKRSFEEIHGNNISKDYTINLAWHLVTQSAANDHVFEMTAEEEGMTTISPTWFTVKDTKGNLNSLADQRYVDYFHKLKKEVWALVKDFDGGINSASETYELLSSTSSRENLINQLMAETLKYGIDGINVDFELVTEECSVHFLQFLRELSVRCKQNEIVLSVDNYVPTEYNMFYDLEEQAEYADYIIIMSYDEHFDGSEVSGPVASTAFVEEAISIALESVPATQLINGVPLYTRLWCEKENASGELSITSEAYSMDGAKMKIAEAGAEIVVDEFTGHNYAEWQENGATYKIWLEDEAALESKLKLMKNNKLAGLATWRLGFESQETWELILKYVN